MMTTKAEENYLKAIFKIADRQSRSVSTSAIAGELSTSAASVTDMIKRLSEKDLVHYEPYRGVTLTDAGLALATGLVRRHRLWEVFLVDKLDFGWDEVHVLAEELEHIKSDELTNRLDNYLGNPRYDPHGDPIPNEYGKFTLRHQVPLSDLKEHHTGTVVGVREHSDAFLAHLDELGLTLDARVHVKERFDYDKSMSVEVNSTTRTISDKVARNVYVKPRSTE